jgi:hypothetical protein
MQKIQNEIIILNRRIYMDIRKIQFSIKKLMDWMDQKDAEIIFEYNDENYSLDAAANLMNGVIHKFPFPDVVALHDVADKHIFTIIANGNFLKAILDFYKGKLKGYKAYYLNGTELELDPFRMERPALRRLEETDFTIIAFQVKPDDQENIDKAKKFASCL